MTALQIMVAVPPEGAEQLGANAFATDDCSAQKQFLVQPAIGSWSENMRTSSALTPSPWNANSTLAKIGRRWVTAEYDHKKATKLPPSPPVDVTRVDEARMVIHFLPDIHLPIISYSFGQPQHA